MYATWFSLSKGTDFWENSWLVGPTGRGAIVITVKIKHFNNFTVLYYHGKNSTLLISRHLFSDTVLFL